MMCTHTREERENEREGSGPSVTQLAVIMHGCVHNYVGDLPALLGLPVEREQWREGAIGFRG